MGDDDPTAAAMTAAVAAATPSFPPSADAYQSLPQSPPPLLRRFSGKSKTGRQSSKFGTVNYSVDEMRRLNDKVRAVMPIAGDDWMHVAYQFNYLRPESIPYREVESLKRKFKKMYCSRSASASGRLPEYIEEAKELRRLINVRSEKVQLETSDTHSEVDAQDGATTSGLGEQIQTPQQLPSGKTEPFEPPNTLLDAANGAAAHSGSSTPRGQQHIPSQNGEGETSEPPAAGAVVNPLAAGQSESHTDELPQDVSNDYQPHEVLPADTAEQLPSEPEINDARVIAGKLNEMELEYRRAMVARTPMQDVADTAASLVASANGQQLSEAATVPAASALTVADESLDSTSGIISMLKHSIERKRRTMEEHMLSESERVRKERKKRKMEQALLSIHQEQHERERERELLNVSLEATTASILGVPLSVGGAVSAASPSSSLGLAAPAPTSVEPSIGMMEIVLQYMVAQQSENERRLQAEQEQRERDQQAKELRWREKERLRRQERREFMLVMAAALEDKFPASLRQFLGTSSVDNDFVGNCTVAAEDEHALRASSTTSSEATEHFESGQLADSHENESTLI